MLWQKTPHTVYGGEFRWKKVGVFSPAPAVNTVMKDHKKGYVHTSIYVFANVGPTKSSQKYIIMLMLVLL